MFSKQLRPMVVFSAAAFAAAAQAQSGKGTLTGTVTDPQGAALQGVRVSLSPGSYTALTSATGQYTIVGVTSGQYAMTVSYAGFDNQTVPVNVQPGQTAESDLKLSIARTAQSVQVYAPREGGELEAINRTFNADNIINVLPSDVINSLPNANVADAIGRLPDVTLERDEGEGKYVRVRGTEARLNHTTLDGVTIASPETVRQIKLDLIPANLVESVQINKTLQANMEADGIGGSIDLRTRTAEDKPTIYLDAEGGYNPILTGRDNYTFDGTLGQRFLGDKKLGALISGSYDFNGRGINDVEPGPALAGTYDLRDYRYNRSRWGLGGTIDYRLNDTSNLFFHYLYAHFDNFGEDWIYSPQINSFVGDSLTQGGPDGTTSFQALQRRPVQDIGGLQLGGHHVLRQSVFSWDVNSSLGRTRDQNYDNARFAPIAGSNPLNNITYNLDVSKPLTPHLNVQSINGSATNTNIFDPTQYFFKSLNQQNTYNPEVDLGFGASLATPYTLAGHPSTFEFGGLFRNEHKFLNQNTRNFYPTADPVVNGSVVYNETPALALSNFVEPSFSDPNYYGGIYRFGVATNYNAIHAFSALSDPGIGDILGNSFNQIEKVSAGYVMNTTNFKRFRVVLGLRFENTGENNLGYVGQTNSTRQSGTGLTPIRVQTSYLNVLPSGSLRYAITPTSGIRFVYSRGLARPNFSDLIPFQSAPSGGNARDNVSQGNPNLNAEYADDIDVLYERTLLHGGLLQGGYFYKHFSNPIVATVTEQSSNPSLTGNNQPYFLNQTINAGTASVYGFEVSFQQHFTYLPGYLNGLGVSANYGYTHSQTNFPAYIDPSVLQIGQISGPDRGDDPHPPLIGQAPNTFNFSPTYDRHNLSVRLGATYNQANISAYQYNSGAEGAITQGGGGGGLRGPNGDQYFYSHFQVDLQGSYNLPKGFTAVAYGLNLTNEVFGFYNGGPDFPVQREFYRQTFGGGLRWSPHRE